MAAWTSYSSYKEVFECNFYIWKLYLCVVSTFLKQNPHILTGQSFTLELYGTICFIQFMQQNIIHLMLWILCKDVHTVIPNLNLFKTFSLSSLHLIIVIEDFICLVQQQKLLNYMYVEYRYIYVVSLYLNKGTNESPLSMSLDLDDVPKSQISMQQLCNCNSVVF